MNRLKEKYNKEVVPALIEKFEYKSVMQAPKVEKIVVNMGVGEAVSNAKALDKAVEELQSKATNVKFTPTLTEGEEIGTLEIDDNSTTLYAPKYEDMTEEEIDEMMGLYGMDDENGDGVSDDFSAIIQEQVIRYFEEEVDLPLIVEEVIDDSLASDEDIEGLK